MRFTLAIGLSLVMLSPLCADPPKKRRGDPTKKKDQPRVLTPKQAIDEVLRTGKDAKAKVTLPVNQEHSLPEVPRPRFAGITLTGRGVSLQLTGGRIPGQWRFKARRAGTATVIMKVRDANDRRKIARVTIEVTFQ